MFVTGNIRFIRKVILEIASTTYRVKGRAVVICPQRLFTCFLWLWEQTTIISLYSTLLTSWPVTTRFCCAASSLTPSVLYMVFYVLLTVHLGLIFVNNQLDAQFFFIYVYFHSLHVSGSHVPITRRINCISTTSGICHSV